jgi:dipeptidyl aminopeptidase/acylaminoacyl peptidase
MKRLALLAALSVLFASPCPAAGDAEALLPTDYAAARKAFKSTIRRRGPSPQEGGPLGNPPAGVKEVEYKSGALRLKAWLGEPPGGGKRPAVVYCHGGFAFGREDFTDEAAKFVEQGFVVLVPILRGENGMPGHFELYHGDVDDAVAAGRFVASLPSVDAKRVFACGHSAGATLALFAALLPDTPYAASAPIGASMNALTLLLNPNYEGLIVFDPLDPREVLIRSAVYFGPSVRRPVYLFAGDQDVLARVGGHQFAAGAARAPAKCEVRVVSGDHNSCKPEALRQIAEIFKSHRPQ